jgi:hypothetical protein
MPTSRAAAPSRRCASFRNAASDDSFGREEVFDADQHLQREFVAERCVDRFPCSGSLTQIGQRLGFDLGLGLTEGLEFGGAQEFKRVGMIPPKREPWHELRRLVGP